MSADGRFVAFVSSAWDLVPGVTVPQDFTEHVYLWDRETGELTAVSRRAGTEEGAGGRSRDPVLSADGSYLAFLSRAPDLVPGQVQGSSEDENVFLYERATGTLRLVSHAAASATRCGAGSSQPPRLSADGRFAVYESTATDLVPGQQDSPGSLDVFLYERQTGAITLASRSRVSRLQAARGDSFVNGLSADGGTVVFTSLATDLVPRQRETRATQDLFVYARRKGSVTLVSRIPASSAARTGNGSSYFSSMSPDGAFVTFTSDATNLVAGGLQGLSDDGRWLLWNTSSEPNSRVSELFLLDRVSGENRKIGADQVFYGRLSADGRRVAFISITRDLLPELPFLSVELFLYDRMTEDLQWVTRSAFRSNQGGNQGTDLHGIGPGGHVLFTSYATDLVPRDGNGSRDVFLYTPEE